MAIIDYTRRKERLGNLGPVRSVDRPDVSGLQANVAVARSQERLREAQEGIRRKVMAMQNKGMGGPKLLAQLEHEQEQAIRGALPILDEASPLQKWSLMVGKQVNVMRGQLLFQVRDYDAARPLLAKAIHLDPALMASPIITTLVDAASLTVLFTFASTIMKV